MDPVRLKNALDPRESSTKVRSASGGVFRASRLKMGVPESPRYHSTSATASSNVGGVMLHGSDAEPPTKALRSGYSPADANPKLQSETVAPSRRNPVLATFNSIVVRRRSTQTFLILPLQHSSDSAAPTTPWLLPSSPALHTSPASCCTRALRESFALFRSFLFLSAFLSS